MPAFHVKVCEHSVPDAASKILASITEPILTPFREQILITFPGSLEQLRTFSLFHPSTFLVLDVVYRIPWYGGKVPSLNDAQEKKKTD